MLIYGVFYFIKKRLRINNNLGDEAYLLSSQSLGPGKWIQVVYVGGKYLILGVTNENISLLTELTDPKEIERFEILYNNRKTEEGHNFMDMISDFFKKRGGNNTGNNEFNYETDSIDFLKKQNERINKMKDQ